MQYCSFAVRVSLIKVVQGSGSFWSPSWPLCVTLSGLVGQPFLFCFVHNNRMFPFLTYLQQPHCSHLVFGCETGGFKATDKARLAQKRAQAAQAVASERQDVAQMDTIQFALKTHRCFKTIALFLIGMFAGITLWHIISTYMLINAGSEEFIQHYTWLAFPVHSLYFFLFAIATVYAMDRYVCVSQ